MGMASNPEYAHTRGPRSRSVPVSKGTQLSMLVKQLLSAIEGHIIGQGRGTGIFEREL